MQKPAGGMSGVMQDTALRGEEYLIVCQVHV